IAESIASSMGKAGKTLTKAITVPALGAVSAVGGIVAAFGWKRLVALDSARAQLQGLGYDAKSVDRISEQVRTAVQGTVTTMAEGVSIAAGGIAAGVKEGKELERYIKLVGDAAVGANRPVADMAQIFNRVQGSGKLMTMELNMIEQGMPGFAMAMAESLGVTQEEFRKMVTNGAVSSEQFLDVMDDFAGEMSGAYAKSWEGMVSNTKAWIGIIGQNILGGVFEKSKESIAGFMEYLKSDDVQKWAAETGKMIGEAFNRMIESVKSAIEWWTGLDDSTKSLITKIAGIAVAIGPVLMIASKLITTVMMVGKWFGIIKGAAGVLIGAIGAISAPVLIVIGVIAGLIAVFVSLYKNNEGFRDLVISVWETIKETFLNVVQAISDFVMEVFGAMVEWWNENNQQILETVMNVWQAIVDVIMIAVGSIVEFVQEIWSGLVSFWEEHG
ncbi:tape measure protein, partial [Microvirga sp. 3-52]|nr:tape measure protein [Microvirga sp. 3-52]